MCRRGMKELDLMLGRYLDQRWPSADADEREAFVALLDMQDPELWNLLKNDDSRRMDGAPTVDPPLGEVIGRIRELSGL